MNFLSQALTALSTITDVIKFGQTIYSSTIQVQEALYNNLEEQCLNLSKELRILEKIHIDLKKKINDKTNQMNTEEGLLDAIQHAEKISGELLAAVSGYRLGNYQVKERYDLKKHILERTQSMQKAKEIVTYALKCYKHSHQYSSDAAVNINSSSEDTVTDSCSKETYDGSKGQETVVNEISESLEETNVYECSPTSSPISHVSSLPPCLPDSSSSSEDTVTDGCSKEAYDGSKGSQTSGNEISEILEETNEPPTFEEIPGIIQPHDVITFKNHIFILMDGGICAYNMAGKRIKRYQGDDGFKPFAATFLGATLCVTDKKSKCVVTFDESLKEKKRFGKHNMIEPAGITSCERKNCIYVLTGRKKESAEIAKFNADGEYLGCYCSDSLEDPWYIKKSSSDEFFISDFARMAVDVFSYDFSHLYTVKTYDHCRGMDIDNKGNIYISLRNPGYKSQYECVRRYIQHKKEWELLENSPVPWFWETKSLDFVRGLHYYRCQNKKLLMVVDAGNKRLKVISL